MGRIKVCSSLLFLYSLLWHHAGFSQDWVWAKYIPWSLSIPIENTPVYIDVKTQAISQDAAGNAYVTGYINVEYNDTYAQGSIFFVAKFNASGNIAWLKHYDQPFVFDAKGADIVADANGNVYVVGSFSGTLSLSNNLLLASTGGSNSDIFIARYNSQGVVQWAGKAGGGSGDYGNGIALDAQGSVFITGSLRGGTDFGNGVFSYDNSPDSRDYFIAKYENNTGKAVWVKRSSSSSVYDGASGRRISIDNLGQIWSVGQFESGLTLENVTLIATSATNPDNQADKHDIFVAKHDVAGNLLWAKNFVGNKLERLGDIVCDGQGNAYVTGSFYQHISLDSIILTALSEQDQDAFVVKLNSAGHVDWAKRIGTSWYDEAKGVGVDANANCYVTGGMKDKLFVRKYKPNGDLDWTRLAQKHYTISYGGVDGNAISTDADGNSYVAGTFFGDLVSFDNINVSGTHGQQSGYSISQGVVAKLSATDLFFPPEVDPSVWEEWPIKPGPDPASLLKAYPNPSDDIITIQFRNPGRDTGYLGIYNQRGQLIYTQEFSSDLDQRVSFRQYGTGFYYARLVMGEDAHMQTIMIE